MMKYFLYVISISVLFAQDVQISGNIQFTQTYGDKPVLNSNTQKDNPFAKLRSKLFIFSALSDNIDIDIELAFDDFAQNDRWIWLHGAAVNFHRLYDTDLLNIKIGKIPMNVGQFVNRVNEAENNLIGVPLIYHYRTLMDWEQVWDGNSQFYLRRYRDKSTAVVSYENFPTASPMAYEAVWDYGINIHGFDDYYEYSFMLSTGSLSNPKKNFTENLDDELQVSWRLGLLPTDWLNLGFSMAVNNFLSTNINQPQIHDRNHFHQELYAYDLSMEFQSLQIYAEYFDSFWDNVNIEKWYKASSGFAEIAWTLPSSTKWQLVARYDFMKFNQILVDFGTPAERKTWWDSDFSRIEAGVVYQMNRKLKMKAIYQHWDYDFYPTQGFTALQLLVLF
jgi:hypothetical protein